MEQKSKEFFDFVNNHLDDAKFGFEQYDKGFKDGFEKGYAQCKNELMSKIDAYIERSHTKNGSAG